MPRYSTIVPSESSSGRSRCNTRVIASSSSSRSWLITSSAPLYDRRKSSIHVFASMSKWFVGSSSSSVSLPLNKIRASSTRRRSPPERTPRARLNRSGLRPRPAAIARPSLSAAYPPLSKNCSSARVNFATLLSLAVSSIAMRSFSIRTMSSSMPRPDIMCEIAVRASNEPAMRGS